MDSSKCTFVCERDENDKKFQCNIVSCPEIPGNAINTIVEDSIKHFQSSEVSEHKKYNITSVYLVLSIGFLLFCIGILGKISRADPSGFF